MNDGKSGRQESVLDTRVPVSPPPADDGMAAALRGFGPIGILAALVILSGNLIFAPLSAILVLLWAHRSHTPWSAIGYVRPKRWLGELLIGIAFGAAFKLVMKAIVMPLLGADPVNHAYHFLAGNPAALPGMLFAVTIGAGFGEETLFRGYLFERARKLLGGRVEARVLTVLLTSLLFGAAHYPVQGLTGVHQATIVGLVFGTIYAVSGRLWMLMFAHAAFDLVALALIYWNLETDVARFIFK